MERLPNRYPKISQSHKVPLYKGLSLFYPKLLKKIETGRDCSFSANRARHSSTFSKMLFGAKVDLYHSYGSSYVWSDVVQKGII